MQVHYTVTKAKESDIDDIYNLLLEYSKKQIVLARSKESILEFLSNFYVVKKNKEVVGCGALKDFDNDLYEIRSLVISKNYSGKGIGRILVEYIIENLKSKAENASIFALTYQVNFFLKLGFKITDKNSFPNKIWADCKNCAKRNCCDETAVYFEIKEKNLSQKTYSEAKKLIPGGTQLLSKRPEMFLPNEWPSYYKTAKGVEVTDLDDNKYIDMSIMGVGASILGYADDDVDNAVINAIKNGVSSTLNCPEEVDLAKKLTELHPWSDMVRYSRSGGEAMSMAVRIARAHTSKEKVLISGYHGWTDWYLAANLGDTAGLDGHLIPGLDPAGVPRSLKGTTLAFHYQDLKKLKELVKENKNEIAAIVMEPQRSEAPAKEYLENVRTIANEIGAVLIFDEITTGFRMCAGGIHKLLGVNPDIAVFAKAMANGYAMSAIIGKKNVMQSAQDTFMSSTNWTERIGSVAALATINKYIECHVDKHIKKIGQMFFDGWIKISDNSDLKIKLSGLPTLSHIHFEHENEVELTTLFTKLMLEKGFLAYSQFKASFAHKEEHLNKYFESATIVVAELAKIKNDKKALLKKLPNGCARRGFYRLTS